MIATTSPLKLVSFYLYEKYLRFIEPEKEVEYWNEIMDQYPIEIDFNHQSLEDDFFQVWVNIEVNTGEEKLPGLHLAAQGVGIFQLSNAEQLQESVAGNLRVFSSLNIVINSLRGELSNASSQSPTGRYYLPAIDIGSLIKSKQATEQAE
ncbi:protein-export chaperone SecB [Nafulsella turpanensis]|uniref:protein-export chaperone SecB n=1 Tax=Nafulsella turpanensis TaxID=1265690 RepID=UPI00034B96E8|nr:protein-export chaperone SecB [Nafulsella turpanensis]